MAMPEFLREIAAHMVGEKISHSMTGGKGAASGGASLLIDMVRMVFDRVKKEDFKRVDFVAKMELMNAETVGSLQPILDLFHEFEKERGVIFVGEHPYRENWTGALLMSFSGAHEWMWPLLAEELKVDREKFFGHLEMLDNDKIEQLVRQFGLQFEQSELGKSIASAANELAAPLEAITGFNGSLRNFRDRLRARATR